MGRSRLLGLHRGEDRVGDSNAVDPVTNALNTGCRRGQHPVSPVDAGGCGNFPLTRDTAKNFPVTRAFAGHGKGPSPSTSSTLEHTWRRHTHVNRTHSARGACARPPRGVGTMDSMGPSDSTGTGPGNR
jgi:hypothetical protein